MAFDELVAAIPGIAEGTYAGLGRCVVTGASGYLGRHLVLALLKCGLSVVGFSRRPHPELQGLPGDYTHVAGDIRDAAAVEGALRGACTVFHTAALCDQGHPKREYYGINCIGTQNVLAACAKNGCRSLIYTSTPSVVIGKKDIVDGTEELPYQPKFLSHYPATKRLAEEWVLAANSKDLRTCALRPHLIWGVDEPHILPQLRRRAAAGRMRQFGSGENVVSLTHIANGVQGHLAAAKSLLHGGIAAGKAYFICDEKPVALWQWIHQCLVGWGYAGVTGKISPVAGYMLGMIAEGVAALTAHHCTPQISRFVVRQLTQSHSFSCQAAKTDIGYMPWVDNRQGLEELWKIKP